MIDKRYKSCSTCKYRNVNCDACNACDCYNNWKMCSYEEMLARGSCLICTNTVLAITGYVVCTSSRCQYELNYDALYELFPESINIDKHTTKGILE